MIMVFNADIVKDKFSIVASQLCNFLDVPDGINEESELYQDHPLGGNMERTEFDAIPFHFGLNYSDELYAQFFVETANMLMGKGFSDAVQAQLEKENKADITRFNNLVSEIKRIINKTIYLIAWGYLNESYDSLRAIDQRFTELYSKKPNMGTVLHNRVIINTINRFSEVFSRVPDIPRVHPRTAKMIRDRSEDNDDLVNLLIIKFIKPYYDGED